jgi:hypothetical protein
MIQGLWSRVVSRHTACKLTLLHQAGPLPRLCRRPIHCSRRRRSPTPLPCTLRLLTHHHRTRHRRYHVYRFRMSRLLVRSSHMRRLPMSRLRTRLHGTNRSHISLILSCPLSAPQISSRRLLSRPAPHSLSRRQYLQLLSALLSRACGRTAACRCRRPRRRTWRPQLEPI